MRIGLQLKVKVEVGREVEVGRSRHEGAVRGDRMVEAIHVDKVLEGFVGKGVVEVDKGRGRVHEALICEPVPSIEIACAFNVHCWV